MFDFIARPLGQLLMLFYELTGNYGLALLLFAVAVKVVLLPFQMKSKKGTMRQTRLQPKVQELQKKHGPNRAKFNEEMQKLYKEEGVNPASGCLWGFLPLPIMFALFQAIRRPLTMMLNIPRELLEEGGAIYRRFQELNFESGVQAFFVEIEQMEFISANFSHFQEFMEYGLQQITFYLGMLNLGQQPLWNFFWHENTDWSHTSGWLPGLVLFLIPLLSGGTQFIQQAVIRKVTPQMPTQEGAGKSMQTVMLLMPLFSVYIGFTLPAALAFYWTVGTVLQIFQELWLNKRYTKILDIEDEERNRLRKIKEAQIEAKRLETERKKSEGIVEKNPNKSKRKKQMGEKQEKLEKTAEWEKKHAPPSEADEEYEPSRVGKRHYARGRAYDPDRYLGVEGARGDESSSEGTEPEDEDDNSELETANPELEVEGEALPDEGEAESLDEVEIPDEAEGLDEAEIPDGAESPDEAESLDEVEEEAPPTVRFDTMRFEEDKKD
ncbi:MAG: membrane protein insertase YidC [Oscillospiraceae bacterium]|nr:membrane protein insertase YidC [Oscillospiraceae bacterium]